MKRPLRSTIGASAAPTTDLSVNRQKTSPIVDAGVGRRLSGEAVECRFEVPGLTLAARAWGDPGGVPVIALHGWLDNAGSFDLLAPQLSGVHVIALDCAGHGHSGHRSPDATYNVWQDVPEVFAVADQLGWEQFNLLGHSRGAAIASLAAGTFPDRISTLVLIDGGIPIPDKPGETPQRFAKSVVARATQRDVRGRVFATREEAISLRSRGFTETTYAAAEILARRSLREAEGGFSWYVDQRLKGESEVRLTPDQITDFMRAVKAPTLALLASRSPLTTQEGFVDMLREIPDIELLKIEGGHHFHLEEAVEEIAQRVQAFFASRA
jgi:pimeloyl-ACP methyl ester carboxylesterase